MGLSRISIPALALLWWFATPSYAGNGCTPSNSIFSDVTNDFVFSATSAEGAVGDVVAVDVSVRIEEFHGWLTAFQLIATYDPDELELLGEPVYSDLHEDLVYFPTYWRIGPGSPSPTYSGVAGVQIGGGIDPNAALGLFWANESVPIATLFFRVKGKTGTSAEIRFSDDEWTPFGGDSCQRNTLWFRVDDHEFDFGAYSTRHVSGEIRIVEGEPTQTEVPTLPPEAKVYDDPTGAEAVFEIPRVITHAGASEVPVDLYITSDYEFVGYTAAGRFPPGLELVRIKQHLRSGPVGVDNERREFWLLSSHATRRMGEEGERVKVATLYFNVGGFAPQEMEIELAPLWNVSNYLRIRGVSEGIQVTEDVSPIELGHGIVRLQSEPTTLGDVNLDYALDLSDAVGILDHLFRGPSELDCVPAADFNQDGAVNLTDPVGILTHLFSGESTTPPVAEVYCD